MVKEIHIDHFAAVAVQGAMVVDVRERHEYVDGHVPGATCLPLAELAHRAHELPRAQPVYLICESGNRSMTAAVMLADRGHQAVSVAGGTSAWRGRGRPVVRGPRQG
ncbi:MAG: rhodanese-like domain-containing protein [Actinomycetes bacterium]